MKLLIVDDEKKTRLGLQNHIDWKSLGIHEVKIAANGEDAVQLCIHYTPEVILSDIRMPGMDGIALCSYLRGQLPDSQIIFLSGYSDKEYLKAAIDLDAVSYVEKPIDVKELEEAVKKAVARLQKAFRQAAEPLLGSESIPLLRQWAVLRLVGQGPGEALAGGLQTIALGNGPQEWRRVLVVKCSRAPEDGAAFEDAVIALVNSALGEFSPQAAFRDARHCVVVIGAHSKQELASQSRPLLRFSQEIAAWNRGDERLFCAAGEPVQGPDRLAGSAQSAFHALQALYFQGYGHTCFYQEDQTLAVNIDSDLYARFARAVDGGDRPGALSVLEELRCRLMVQDKALASSVKNVYFRFAFWLQNTKEKDVQPDRKYIWEQFLEFETLEETHAYLCRQVEERLAFPQGSSAVARSIHLIRQRYADEALSVKSLCKELFLTPTYFSGLFKRETGKTVGQYITDVRMEHAKELLQDRRLKLYHVAVAVGYTDPSYFTKAFKKTIGVMPSEYRERHLS